MGEGESPARPRGRPHSEGVDKALIEAALAEFDEHGYRGMSMGSIAARAGVSKVSLYRRWPSKQAIAAELFRLMSDAAAPEDQGSLEADVRHLLGASLGSSGARSSAKILMRTMGEISGNPELLSLYREQLLAPRLEQIRGLVERSRERGELKAGLPTDLASAMIAGPLFLYYLVILAEAELDLPSDLVEALTNAILGGISG
jgi:AcrR family transcriptional regulator